MISFNYETDFSLDKEESLRHWIGDCIANEGYKEGEINYIFCDDAYLLNLNIEFLDHDTLTDIISFDYTLGKLINGDIYISVERVKENASEFEVSISEEIRRVMIHGILHYCGYQDKTENAQAEMTAKENYYINSFDEI